MERKINFWEILKQDRYFIAPSVIFWFVSIIFSLLYTKVETQIWFNELNLPALDKFYYYITYFGDTLFFFAVLFVGLYFSSRFFLQQVFMGSVMILLIYLMKQLFDTTRPYPTFESLGLLDKLKLVENVKFYYKNSFPSGHTTTIFSIMTLISFYAQKKSIKIGLFFFALLVSYSRIFLMQHFLVDLIGGSFMGIVLACLTYYITENSRWFNNIKWIQTPIYKKLKK